MVLPIKYIKVIRHFIANTGTEELAHMEIVSTIVHQLTRNLTIDEIKAAGFEAYFVDHTVGLWPQAASGMPFSSTFFQSKGDAITDLVEDMAAEQKARTTYDNILRMIKDPDIIDPIRFLREREIVHFQRFGETNRAILSKLKAYSYKGLELNEKKEPPLGLKLTSFGLGKNLR
ncbi:manganese catalase family protein [Anaerocolumna sp. MB42-C2]|uniref:manganese catalase family protein n=1 Tax=Anaerocolumna sp. MB42-C2 TaxID=3070997 RepID=UPI0027E0143E|nr:manganese catalase family protein [Anaerocolumna sp. MB42-C2]WMJ90472.1 manganese catalase family protein [Anaerocolumna sp. MB42-C2]